MKRLVLVIPVFNEESVLPRLMEALGPVMDRIDNGTWPGGPWSALALLVDDGSTDSSWRLMESMAAEHPRIGLLGLSRNFGHESALRAGLLRAADMGADAVVVLDADLQDPPTLIPELLGRHLEGYHVVNAHRSRRDTDNLSKRLTAAMFYGFINALSGKVRIPANVGNFRLISRRVLDALNAMPESNRVFRVMVPWLGFPTASVDYERPPRPAGTTHYSWKSMIRLALDGITSATTIPLKLAVRVGFLVAGLGFAYLALIIWQALFTRTTIEGWPSTMSVILFLGGIQLMFMGMLGEYLGRLFHEVKARPDPVVHQWIPPWGTVQVSRKNASIRSRYRALRRR